MVMSGNLKEKLTRPSIWFRLVYMIVFAIAFNVAEIVIFAIVIFQFFATLFTGQPNAQITRFGRNLASYIQQIVCFMTFATEEKPFPFSSWPDASHKEPTVVETDNLMSSKTARAKTVDEKSDAAKPKKPAPRKASAASKDREPAAAKKPKKPATRKTAATRKPQSPLMKET